MSTTSCFQNILMATDFSDCATAGVKSAVSLARKFHAKLTLAHVVHPVDGTLAMMDYGTAWQATFDELERLRQSLCDAAQQRLDAWVAEYRLEGIEVTTQILSGLPYLGINEAVRDHAYDLVVVGTRGMSAVKRLLVGSTATRLARTCPVPVWIARSEFITEGQPILVPLDFSPIGARLLSVAGSLASTLRAKLHVLHAYDVADFYGVPPLSEEIREEFSAFRRYARRAAMEKLEHTLHELGIERHSVTLHVAAGPADQVIDSTAQGINAGLIVVGSVGRGGISGLLIGNTAEKVLHTAERSVLVVKPDELAKRENEPVNAGTQDLAVAAASATRRRW